MKAGLITGVMVALTLIFAVIPGMTSVAVVCAVLAVLSLILGRKS